MRHSGVSACSARGPPERLAGAQGKKLEDWRGLGAGARAIKKLTHILVVRAATAKSKDIEQLGFTQLYHVMVCCQAAN